MRSQYAALMDEIVKRWSSSEACHLPLEGCSEAEIEEIKRRQGVERLPEMYVEFLRRMGRRNGGFEGYYLDDLRYPFMLVAKQDTYSQLQMPDIFILENDIERDYATYFYVRDDDPILYGISYAHPELDDPFEVVELNQLSGYLIGLVEGAIEEHEVIKKRRSRETEGGDYGQGKG